MVAGDMDAGDSEVSRKKGASVSSWLRAAEKEKALEGPEDLCPGQWARLVRHTSKIFPFLFFFLGVFLFHCFLYCVAASLRAFLSFFFCT